MTCKDCVHYEVCGKCSVEGMDYDQYLFESRCPRVEFDCPNFKPKSRFVELPCEVGDKVYRIWSAGKHGKSVAEFVVTSVSQIAKDVWVVKYQKQVKNLCSKPTRYQCSFDDFGKTVFLSREEAEKALAERSK